MMRMMKRAPLVALAMIGLAGSAGWAAESEAKSAFIAQWGPKIRAVLATRQTSDDLDLARQMLAEARSPYTQGERVKLLCDQCYLLASREVSGLTTAVDAMSLRASKMPELRNDSAEKAVSLAQRIYVGARGEAKTAAGQQLIEIMQAQAELFAESGGYDQAGSILKRAQAVATAIHSDLGPDLRAQAEQIAARQQAAAAAAKLEERLKANPQDKTAAMELAKLELIELDKPAAAIEHARAAGDPAWVANLELSAKVDWTANRPDESLNEDQWAKLAAWYRDLADRSGKAAGAGRMLLRAHYAYNQIVVRHAPGDPMRQKLQPVVAQLEDRMKKRGIDVPPPPSVDSAGVRAARRKQTFFGISTR